MRTVRRSQSRRCVSGSRTFQKIPNRTGSVD
nr:MAG TPA: hypothetical protein [Caudoviricetes sp.]